MRGFLIVKNLSRSSFYEVARLGRVVIIFDMSKQVEKTKLKKTSIRKTGDASWVTKNEFQKHEETMSTMFGYVMERFDAHDQQFISIDQRFEAIDRRFDVVDERFEAIDRRFDSIDQQFRVMNQQFSLINQQFKEMRDERTTIYASLFKNEHDIARTNERIQVLETGHSPKRH